MADDFIVRFHNVTLGYGKKAVLRDVNFEIRRGDFVGIIGPNGAGKTTLLRAVLGLIRPMNGRIVRAGNLRDGYVMQRQNLDTLFPFTVEDIVRMGRLGHKSPWQRMNLEDRARVDDALAAAGIAELRRHLYRELSGGQKQRALIARALAAEPDVLLLDEPTNDMDPRGEAQIMSLVQHIRREQKITVILVSHLLHVVLNHAEKLLLLVDGRARLHAIGELLAGDRLSHVYGLPMRIGESDGKKYLLVGD